MGVTPESIGPYEVIRPLAQGGMAEVYEVREPLSGDRVALKLLIETRSSIKRFNREFEALTRLNHPSIVRVYRYGFHERMPWLTMELLEGEPLQSHIKGFGEPGELARTDEVIRIGWTVANALQYIHDRGLVHRDLKSANVQVLPDGRIKIFDFGTAHLAHALERITQEGDFVGTFSYASPEQIVGGAVDHRADLYSLGVLLYRLATGRRPFKASDPQKVAQMHLRQVARPVRELVPEVPEGLERIIHWMLEKKKKDRPQSAEEVARALEDVSHRPLSLAGHAVIAVAERPIGRASELREAWSWLQRRDAPGLVVFSGSDARERSRITSSFGDECVRRSWRGVVVGQSEQPARALLSGVRALAVRSEVAPVRELAGWLTEARAIRVDADGVASGLRDRLGDLARDRAVPSLLVLQELQDWDTEAIRVAQILVDVLVAERALLSIVVTAESGDAPAVTALARVIGDVHRVELVPLDVRGTAQAVAQVLLRRPPPMEVARRIHAESFGYPSRVESVVRGMVESGQLSVRDDDGNRVEWSRTARASGLVDELAEEEHDALLARVPVSSRRVLEVLAVLGGVGAPRPVAHALGVPEDGLAVEVRTLEALGAVKLDPVTRHLVAVDRRLLHAVERGMHPARRRVVQQLVVDALPADRPTPPLVRVLAAMGRNEAAIRAAVRVGVDLLERGDAAAALELLEPLRPAASHPGLDPATRSEYHLLLGRCIRAVRPLDPAGVRAIHQADALAADPERKSRIQLAYAEFQGAIGHQSNYRKHLLAAWELIGGRPPGVLHAEVAHLIAQNRLVEGDLVQAASWTERCRSCGERARSAVWVGRAEMGVAALEVMRGQLAEATERLDRVAPLSGAAASPTRAADRTAEGEAERVLQWEALRVRAQIMRRAGRFSEVLAPLERAVADARVLGPPQLFLRLLLTIAAVELDLVRLGAAQEYVDELIEGIALGERLQLRLAARVLQGRIHLVSGQLGLAQVRLREVVEQAELAGLSLVAEEARAYLAEVCWAVGQRKESMDLYRRAVVRLMEIGDVGLLADVLVSRARSVGGLEDPERGFKQVATLLDKAEYRVLYLEYVLAEQRWHRAHENAPAAERALREAQTVFNAIAARQSRVEQAAMRVHPWMQEIKRSTVGVALPSSSGSGAPP